MSFAKQAKIEIMQQVFKSNCCRMSFVQGVLAARGRLDNGVITLSLDSQDSAEYFAHRVKEIYSKECEISTMPRGGRGRLLKFQSKSAERYLSDFESELLIFDEKCPSCQSYFLRGIFWASGRVSDPVKQYLLEFSPKEHIKQIVGYFESVGLCPLLSAKKNETRIYFKNSGFIEDYFALAGMNNEAFALMNAKIQAQIRNDVNRVSTCEANNIDRAVAAAKKNKDIINELIERGLLSQLPDELQETARLRAVHSELSLSQLAGIFTPRLTKSGLSHRLRKINELGKALLDEE